jgi:hypothetical protein
MRLLLLLIILVGCSSPETKTQSNETQAVDSILEQSQRSFITADSVSRETDKVIGEKVEKAVSQITVLQTQVKTLKQENNVLKIKLDSATDDAGKPFKLLPVSNGENHR